METIETIARALPASRSPAGIGGHHAASIASAVKRAVQQVAVALRRWDEVRRQKHALNALDTRLLRDVGLSQDDARQAFRRSPWDRIGL